MEMKSARGRLFLLLALLVSLPLLNSVLHIIDNTQLHGAASKVELTPLSPESWWDGVFQRERNDYVNDSISLRPDLVRVANQLDLWMFHKTNAASVVIGKDNYLYEAPYINEYDGVDQLSKDTIALACYRLRRLQDTLDKLGKTLVFAISPSKAYYYADKLPTEFSGRAKATNYMMMSEYARMQHIRFIDYNAWFLAMKDTTHHVLIPRKGIHWSEYAARVASDSLVWLIEASRHITLPHRRVLRIYDTLVPHDPDIDISRILNLAVPIKDELLSYYTLDVPDTAGTTQPKMIFLGDSYLWHWASDGIMSDMSRDWEFWHYFYEVWTPDAIGGKTTVVSMHDHNWSDVLNRYDCLVILYNPINLPSFVNSTGALHTIYSHYYPKG